VHADNDGASVAPRLDPENQLAVLESRKGKEPVGRPELGGAVLGLLRAHDADIEFVLGVHLSSRSVVAMSLLSRVGQVEGMLDAVADEVCDVPQHPGRGAYCQLPCAVKRLVVGDYCSR